MPATVSPSMWPRFTAGLLLSLVVAQPALANESSVLVQAEGRELVQAHCSGCHSLSLVIQNRGDRQHWLKLIRWMQAEQKLWDLGEAEEPILTYLAKNYGAPANIPRRQPLNTVWLEPGKED